MFKIVASQLEIYSSWTSFHIQNIIFKRNPKYEVYIDTGSVNIAKKLVSGGSLQRGVVLLWTIFD